MSDRDVFYDACFEAWRSGRNPDLVDPDQLDYAMNGLGANAEEAIAYEMRRITPPKRESDEEREAGDV